MLGKKILRFPNTVSRSVFCENCEKHHRPLDGTAYVAYGSEERCMKLFIHKNIHIPERYRGLSPHIITKPRKRKSGLWTVNVRCGVNRCGVDVFHQTYDKDIIPFLIANKGPTRVLKLTEADMVGLYQKDRAFYLGSNLVTYDEAVRISTPMSFKEFTQLRIE